MCHTVYSDHICITQSHYVKLKGYFMISKNCPEAILVSVDSGIVYNHTDADYFCCCRLTVKKKKKRSWMGCDSKHTDSCNQNGRLYWPHLVWGSTSKFETMCTQWCKCTTYIRPHAPLANWWGKEEGDVSVTEPVTFLGFRKVWEQLYSNERAFLLYSKDVLTIAFFLLCLATHSSKSNISSSLRSCNSLTISISTCEWLNWKLRTLKAEAGIGFRACT